MRSILILLLILPVFAEARTKVSFSSEITVESLRKLEKKIITSVDRLTMGRERVIVIELESGGGNLYATLGFIKRLKEASEKKDFILHTKVSGSCESSCTVLYTLGTERLASSRARFGFHSPAVESRLPKEITRDSVLTKARRDWLSAIGLVDERLVGEIDRRGLLKRSAMSYLNSRELLTGYVTKIE